MADPSEQAGGNTSTEDTEENKTWDELFVYNPDEYFGNTNSKQESRPKIGDPKEVALHTYVTDNKYTEISDWPGQAHLSQKMLHRCGSPGVLLAV